MAPPSIEQAMEHHRAGRVQQAESLYRQILATQPDHSDALHLLGLVIAGYKRFGEAIGLIERAIAKHPEVSDYEYNLAQVLEAAGQNDRAIAAYRRACAIKPEFAESFNNLGAALLAAGNPSESVEAFRKALALRPDLADAHVCMGIGLQRQLKYEEAIQSFRQAITLRPGDALANYNLGTALLTTGRLTAGWEGYERRWQIDQPRASQPNLSGTMWDSSDPRGKRILLWPEQGFGDAIQFARFAPLLAKRGASVILSAPPELQTLMRSLDGIEQVTGEREPRIPFDLHAPLLSLPRLFGTTLANIPADIPYLHADPARSAKWKERLPSDPNCLKIGLAWGGRPTHADDRNRSIPLDRLRPLLRVPGTWFTSLQKGNAGPQIDSLAPALQMTDWTAELHDFADTAALIDALDLVIAVDTAVAHLAGALGKPVWLLLPFVPDWRWMLHRSDSPWYPTMRLFRQPSSGDWNTPIQEIAQTLTELPKPKD